MGGEVRGRSVTMPSPTTRTSRAPVDRDTSDVIPAAGWAAVYDRDDREFAWPLIAWLRPPSGTGPLLVGLALGLDGRAVVRADEIEGFKCYLPPAEWVAGVTDEPAAEAPPRP